MEIRAFVVACSLAAVAARSPFYGDPRWKCISRAPGDNPGEVHIIEKPDLCIYYCTNDNETWNFGLYLDKTPCKVEGKGGVCIEGECTEPVTPPPNVTGPNKETEKEGNENTEPPTEGPGSASGPPATPSGPTEGLSPGLPETGDTYASGAPPTPGPMEDLSPSPTETGDNSSSPDQGEPTPVTGMETEP